MCIVIVSTSHPHYPLILINNRDEYVRRPTAIANWWPDPHSQVLGGRDMLRSEHGTWLGMTQQGRLACLTNFREEGTALIQGARSRGVIVNAYLKTPPASKLSTRDLAEQLIQEGVKGVGGFSLLFGHLRRPCWDELKPTEPNDSEISNRWDGLAIVSNRSTDVHSVEWLCKGQNETHALSNSHYGDRSWPKVVEAEKAVEEAVAKSVASGESKDALIGRLLGVLSADSMPSQELGEDWMSYLRQLRKTIFVPILGDRNKGGLVDGQSPMPDDQDDLQDIATSGVYATQKQSVILVDWDGHATFFERTWFDYEGRLLKSNPHEVRFDFKIEGW